MNLKEIIIIEDSKLYQQKIKDAVLDLGYKVTGVFAYGEKALDYILKENNHPDLLIIDIILEGKMNGYKLAKKISSESNIPFIFLSGRADVIKDFEASVYLNKPFNKQELKNNIELVLYKYNIFQKMLKNNEEKEMILDTTEAQICNISNKKVFNEKNKIYSEEWLENDVGEKRLLKITKNPKLNEKGEVEYVVCSAEDITENKENEKIIKDLHQIAVDFKELNSEKEICEMTVEAAEDLLNFNLCIVLLVKKESFIKVASSIDFEKEKRLISDKSVAAKTFNESRSLIIDDLQNHPDAISVENIYKSAISIPIGNYGVFQAAAPQKNYFTENDLELAEILISHTAAALDRLYAQEKIKKQKEYLNTILNAIPEIIILLDEEGNYLNILTSNSDDLVDTKDNLIGKNVIDVLPKNIANKYLKYCKKVYQEEKIKKFDYMLNFNEEKKYFDVIFSPINSKDKIGKCIIATIRNITELKTREIELKEQKAYFEQLFNNSTEAIVLLDNKHRVLKTNKKFESMFGFKESELINKNLDNFILPEYLKEVGKKYTENVKNGKKVVGESIRKTKSGEKINVYLQGFPIKLVGGQIGIYALYKDITERKKREKQVHYLSFHDEMTGLYNRRYFENELKRLESSRKYPITIVIGDLDGLKTVNDNYGHQKGDSYIINAADILKSTSRAEDIVARIGGDEFAIVLPATNQKEGKRFCQRIQKNIEKFNKDRDLVKPLSISLGFEVMEDSSQSLNKVFNKADQKMYMNKGRK